MLHPNSYVLAQATHQQRLAAALQRQQQRALRAPRIRRQLRLLFRLGNHLIVLGQKIKPQPRATQPA
jgi:hypothetical protein